MNVSHMAFYRNALTEMVSFIPVAEVFTGEMI